MNILVIGSANADLVITTEIMPVLGQTVTGQDFSVNAGGKGLNQAVAISKLGGNVSFLGLVGDDPNGKMLMDTFSKYGVQFAGKALEDCPTGVAVITVAGADNCIILSAGANDKVTQEFIEENADLIDSADYIVLQLEIPIDTITKICQLAKAGKAKVILNPAPYKELPEEIYRLVDYLIPNEHEACDLTGIKLDSRENCIEAVKKLQIMGVPNVIITLGEQGCVYNYEGEIIIHPAQKTTAVDATSAGDSFIGALTVKLSEGVSLPDAIAYASKVSAITVSRKGAAKSIPYKNEVL